MRLLSVSVRLSIREAGAYGRSMLMECLRALPDFQCPRLRLRLRRVRRSAGGSREGSGGRALHIERLF